MNINGKKILIFPEYHLTDFPPQMPLSREEAQDILKWYEKFGFDVLISGYVERENSKNYSSCLVIDGDKTHNIRKIHVYNDEQKYITSSEEKRKSLNLSIGRTLIIICYEFKFLNDVEYRRIVEQDNIENLLLISAMFHKFKENTDKCIGYCKENEIKRFITSDRFFGLKITEIE